MDQDIRQLVSGLPAVLDAVEDLLEPPEQRQNSVPLSDMVRSSAIMIRKEVSLCRAVGCSGLSPIRQIHFCSELLHAFSLAAPQISFLEAVRYQAANGVCSAPRLSIGPRRRCR